MIYKVNNKGFALLEKNGVCDSHLHNVGQQSLEGLVLPVAQEAVCVQGVVLAIQTQLHHVVFVLYFLLSRKCYLGGCSAEIKRSHCGSAGAQPVPHKTILQRNDRGNKNILIISRSDYTFLNDTTDECLSYKCILTIQVLTCGEATRCQQLPSY